MLATTLEAMVADGPASRNQQRRLREQVQARCRLVQMSAIETRGAEQAARGRQDRYHPREGLDRSRSRSPGRESDVRAAYTFQGSIHVMERTLAQYANHPDQTCSQGATKELSERPYDFHSVAWLTNADGRSLLPTP